MKQRKQPCEQILAELLYGWCLYLYPRAHRRTYGPLMLQTFKDHCNETRQAQGRIGITFWLEVFADETKRVLRERIDNLFFALEKLTLSALLDWRTPLIRKEDLCDE